ncbi:deazaflavin-dependent oxidoreductase, nitroreductase family [Mycolicibacterium rutilum]|uniref:Deazaflavin-dependent oxidoreductase, nitroreductase family n=2 Tax=Mycolicibacterium rutilum TaxID=370526 RepID=A0A1H6IRN0_MYCRU|nr:deazaflavin-dependent oxidoreductase, nitroreductase family [Mycolicibacterium rutilum]
MMSGMQLPQWLARFNRHVTNPIQRMWAGWAPTMGVLEHTGRRSGRRYRTPLTVFPTRDGFAVLLTYGPDRDWLKNISADGGGRITRYGRTFSVRDPRVVPKAQAASLLTGWMRPLFALLPFDQAVLLTRMD